MMCTSGARAPDHSPFVHHGCRVAHGAALVIVIVCDKQVEFASHRAAHSPNVCTLGVTSVDTSEVSGRYQALSTSCANSDRLQQHRKDACNPADGRVRVEQKQASVSITRLCKHGSAMVSATLMTHKHNTVPHVPVDSAAGFWAGDGTRNKHIIRQIPVEGEAIGGASLHARHAGAAHCTARCPIGGIRAESSTLCGASRAAPASLAVYRETKTHMQNHTEVCMSESTDYFPLLS
jgi:hypothetical protein